MDKLTETLAALAVLWLAWLVRLIPQRRIRIGPVKRPACWWRE